MVVRREQMEAFTVNGAPPSQTSPQAAQRGRAGLRNVLHVNRVNFLGGVERVILTLSDDMGRRGYRPVILCPPGGAFGEEAERRGVAILAGDFDRMRITANPLVLAGYPGALARGMNTVVERARAENTALLHLHHPVTVLYAARAIRKLGIPAILHVHEIGPARPLYALALRRAAKLVDAFICVSQASASLLDVAEIGERPVHLVNNGVDPDFLSQMRTAPTSAVTGAGPHIGMFGVIEPRKGQDVLIRAAGELIRRHPEAQIWLVGPLALKDKAGYHQRLVRLVADHGLDGRVHFVGYRPDPAAWMRAMDVVVLPSISNESFGMVLAEAMMLGRAVVASRIGGTGEVIRDGETGHLVKPNDPAALAGAIGRALASSPEFIERARIDAITRFSPDGFRDRIAAIYDQVLATRMQAGA